MADTAPTASGAGPEGSFRYRLLDALGKDQLQDAPDAQRRLQALIANWLRMENVVCLIGAGCSIEDGIGGKSVGKLEDAVLKIVHEKWKANDSIRKLIESRQSEKSKKDLLGFERWLTVLTNVSSLTNLAGTPIEGVSFKVGKIDASQIDELLKDIESAIYGYCALRLGEPSEQPVGHHAFFAKLIARDPALGRSQIFTLNYDTIIEQALDHLGIFYFDGFSGRADPKFDPTSYGLDIYYPGDVSEGRVRRFDRFMHLYKLHGSVHWVIQSDGSITARHPNLAALQTSRSLGDEKARLEQLSTLWPANEGRLGILPTANKFVQTLEAPFAHLFRFFQQRLQVPQTFLFVCGYGFGDEHVNSMIESGLMNVSLSMLIVCPDYLDFEKSESNISKWIERHRYLGERIFVLCPANKEDANKIATFDDFSSNIMPQVKWLDEFAALRRLEKSIEPSIARAK
jgi:hypothetical protein